MSDDEITDYTGEPIGGYSLTGQQEGKRASRALATMHDTARLHELWGWQPAPVRLTSSAQRTTFQAKGEQDHNTGE